MRILGFLLIDWLFMSFASSEIDSRDYFAEVRLQKAMSEPRCFNPLPTRAEDWLPSAAKQNPNADGRACGRHDPMTIQRLPLMEEKRAAIVAAARQAFPRELVRQDLNGRNRRVSSDVGQNDLPAIRKATATLQLGVF